MAAAVAIPPADSMAFAKMIPTAFAMVQWHPAYIPKSSVVMKPIACGRAMTKRAAPSKMAFAPKVTYSATESA